MDWDEVAAITAVVALAAAAGVLWARAVLASVRAEVEEGLRLGLRASERAVVERIEAVEASLAARIELGGARTEVRVEALGRQLGAAAERSGRAGA